ncbi:MAG: hypothetical protein WA303_22365 [Bradyrhizobium sp.]
MAHEPGRFGGPHRLTRNHPALIIAIDRRGAWKKLELGAAGFPGCRRFGRNGTIHPSKRLRFPGFRVSVMAASNPCGLALGGGLV